MPQAIVDPDEVRQFARNLHKFNVGLREQLITLNNQLQALGTSWRDQEHRKFVDHFDEQTKLLTRFLETNEEHAHYLVRKAATIDDYLQS